VMGAVPASEVLPRLSSLGINLVPMDLDFHYVLERDGFIAFVERHGEAFGKVGSAGLLTSAGLAPLVWQDGKANFVQKASRIEATEDQIASLRAFQADLESAVRHTD